MSFLIFRHFPLGPVQFGLSLSNNLVSMRLLWLMTLAPDLVNTRSRYYPYRLRSQSKYPDKGKGIVYVLRIIPPHSYSWALVGPLGNKILASCLRFFFLNKWETIWTSLSRCLFTQETHLDCGKITSNGHKDSATLMWNFCSTSYTSVQLVKHRGSCRYFVLEGSWSLQCMTLKSLEHDSASLSSVTLTFMLQATWRAYPEKEYKKF